MKYKKWWLLHFKKPPVITCSFLTMVKTEKLSREIRILIIHNHKKKDVWRKGIRPSLKTLVYLNQWCATLSRYLSMDIRTGEKNYNKSLPRLVWKAAKTPTSKIEILQDQATTVWGQGFNQYHMPHIVPNEALWLKCQEGSPGTTSRWDTISFI